MVLVVPSPRHGDGQRPVAFGAVMERGRRAPQVAGNELLRVLDEPVRDLRRPAAPKPQLEPPGDGVGRSPVEIPPVFVRLAAVEGRALQSDAAAPPPGRDHVARDVGGVEPMVREGRRRVLARGGAVHEGDGPERGLAHGRELQPDRAAADGPPVGRGQVHEEVVRMLPVHERLALERFARLEQLGRATFGEGRGLERVHHHESETTARDVALEHEHVPVAGLDGVVAGRSALVVVLETRDAHGHERPRGHGHARHGVVGGHARHAAHVGLEERRPWRGRWRRRCGRRRVVLVLREARRGPGHHGQAHAGDGRTAHPHKVLGTPRSRPARA